ncbi:carboxylating nicotinate-nucleotide diphosphorylase [Komagataeibacter sp. AV436]|uniref:nicotinate-nucleotide diphosphorylase (carboxylating) n=1 Tax=Komagataeibacter melomenusus TaxID=2766578 RepID=A0ABX2ADL4_9PROT|nr:carboxylating nicotinate-nucleotide diphosphorylase [Komagataeibacter melomenusus]MBV1830766.1 carboxylating nicotinate-nucleotide diphosphorylase [Komagataeibacter melomenusus]NPC66423.1 carboxylating nicotinate-nucleotide diphosphorylase [Komagataeibacter melomenusus]
MLHPLPDIMLEPLVRAGLLEDLGRAGDLTTDAVIGADDTIVRAAFVARQEGVIAGLDMARLSFALMDRRITFTPKLRDGGKVGPGDVLAMVEGPARGILSGERVGLNFLSHLSGIATATAAVVDLVRPYHARITCTRKTMPGLRAIQKYAVRAGGGSNHRFGLDDAILIKDNHLAFAGGVRPAVERARAAAGHLVRIELEVDTLEQLREGLETGGVDVFLLDNMPPATLREAVKLVNGRAITEASGGITPDTVTAVAQAGVDLISLGWLTHTVRVMDIGLDYQP